MNLLNLRASNWMCPYLVDLNVIYLVFYSGGLK